MPLFAQPELLAQLPDSYVYASPWKLLVATMFFTLWVMLAQWVDRDTVIVNTYRIIWNVVTMACGIVATALLIFLPIFLAGLGAFIVVVGALAMTYVIHRNGLVLEEDKVMTADHISRVMKEGFKSKKEKKKVDVRERVRITGAEGVVDVPEEEEDRIRFGIGQDLLFDALWRRASFLHLKPANNEIAKVQLDIDGILTNRDDLPRQDADAAVYFFKQVAGLDLAERRKPQKKTILAVLGDTHRYDVEVNSKGTSAGESLTLRIIGKEKKFKLPDLGFSEEQLKQVREVTYEDNGLIVLSAPPGQGLTTSVYSFTRSHDAFLLNIQMLEYESELVIDNITSHIYKPSQEKPYSQELLRVFRTDPNVVVLPDIRDKEAFPIVAKAAATKQLVYVALQTVDLFDALKKTIALIGDQAAAAKALSLVAHQRLVRKLCESCKAAYKPDAATLKKINLPPNTVLYRKPEPEYDKHGNEIICQSCQGTGYDGRTAVFAILQINDELRSVIASAKSFDEIKAAAAQHGSLSLQTPALQKVTAGITDIEEVRRALRPPQPPHQRRRAAG